MPVIALSDDVGPTRRRASSNGTGFWLTSYIGANRYTDSAGKPPAPGSVYPMAFLVEQDAGAVIGAHYHQADQFQVIIGGCGRLGGHDVAVADVHFASAWSPYGPLAAGSEGLRYFTLRNGWDPGARYMEFSDNRANLRAVPRRHREVVGVIEPTSDGLCARRHCVAAGDRVVELEPSSGGGQFWLVSAGSLIWSGAELLAMSCMFLHPDEAPVSAIAGDGGLDVQVLQFPRRRNGNCILSVDERPVFCGTARH